MESGRTEPRAQRAASLIQLSPMAIGRIPPFRLRRGTIAEAVSQPCWATKEPETTAFARPSSTGRNSNRSQASFVRAKDQPDGPAEELRGARRTTSAKVGPSARATKAGIEPVTGGLGS